MNFVMQLTNLLVEVEEKEEGKVVVEVVVLEEEIPKYQYLEVEVEEDHNLDKVKVRGVSLRIKANLKIKGSNLEAKDLLLVDLAQVA